MSVLTDLRNRVPGSWCAKPAKPASPSLARGLLQTMTKTVIETALDEELSEHLGYDRHDPAGHGSGNSRIRIRSKTVLTDYCGSVEIQAPVTVKYAF